MNKSKEENNQDIKPVRSEAVSNRGQRRVKGGSMLFSSTITIVNTIGIVLLGLWFFNTSGSQQQAGKSFIERISMLEENISIQSSKVDDLIETNSQDLKFINKEIRKLWDLSNKKNRKSISQNLNSIESIEDTLGALDKEYKTLSAKQRSLNLELAKLEKMQEKLSESLDIKSPSSEGKDIEARLSELEEATKSMDLYSQFLIQFIYAFQTVYRRIETFVFSTSLHRITDALKQQSMEEAVYKLSENVPNWSGGTKIGASLKQFVDEHSMKVVDPATVVLVISDGWDTGEVEVLSESAILNHHSKITVCRRDDSYVNFTFFCIPNASYLTLL